MKTRINTILILLCTVAVCSISPEMLAQNDTGEAAAFSINIKKNGNNITLKCTAGCNWDEIILNKEYTAIDANGVVEEKDAANASLFLFDIKKTATGMILNGMKGTQWKNSPFNIKCETSCKLMVNNMGLPQ